MEPKIEKLTKDLIRVYRRLALNEIIKKQKFDKEFFIIIQKIQSKGTTPFTRKDKQVISEYYTELMFFMGKRMAYGYVLCKLLGEKEANRRILKGMEGEKNFDKYGNKIFSSINWFKKIMKSTTIDNVDENMYCFV